MDKAINGKYVLAVDHETVEQERDALLCVKDAALMLIPQHNPECHCSFCSARATWEKLNEQGQTK